MAHFYVTPFNFAPSAVTGGMSFQAPVNDNRLIGVKDLRSYNQMGYQGGAVDGAGLFAYSTPVSMGGSEIYLGDDPDALLTGRQKSGIESITGLRVTTSDLRSTVSQFLRCPAVVSASPCGGQYAQPISRRGQVKFSLGGVRFFNQRAVTEDKTNAAERFRFSFKRMIANCEDPVEVEKNLYNATRNTFGSVTRESADLMLPPEHQGYRFRPPDTEQSDCFGDCLMTTWTALVGCGWQDTCCQARNSINCECASVYDTSVGGACMYAEIPTLFVTNILAGPTVRSHATADTYYVGAHSVTTLYAGVKVVCGTSTCLCNATGTCGDTTLRATLDPCLACGNLGIYSDFGGACETLEVTSCDTAIDCTHTRGGLWAGNGGSCRARAASWKSDVLGAVGIGVDEMRASMVPPKSL